MVGGVIGVAFAFDVDGGFVRVSNDDVAVFDAGGGLVRELRGAW